MSNDPETVEKDMTDQEVQEALRREDAAPESEQPESDDGRETMAVDTAFVIFVQDGVGFAVSGLGEVEVDLGGKAVRLESMKTADAGDMFRYCSEVAKDIQVSETATQTVRQMAMYTQQLQQQMQNQQMAQKIQQSGGPGGLHVPGM